MHDTLLGGVNTLVKSLNQLTKNELIDLVKDREVVIADLNARIDELEKMAIKSEATPLNADTSRMLSAMSQRIKHLEEQVGENGAG
jgi:hypothetical protein